jgi:hypothetical protein
LNGSVTFLFDFEGSNLRVGRQQAARRGRIIRPRACSDLSRRRVSVNRLIIS